MYPKLKKSKIKFLTNSFIWSDYKLSKYKREYYLVTEIKINIILTFQVGTCISRMFNLVCRFLNTFPPRAFVKVLPAANEMRQIWLWSEHLVFFSLTTWLSSSMCLVHLWYTGFAAMWRETWLSSSSFADPVETCL